MTAPSLPLILDPSELLERLDHPEILVVDLCKEESYTAMHIPGAIHIDYSQIVTARPPVGGLVPDAASLEELFSSIGLAPGVHVIACDDEGGGRASRFLWTLEAVGHNRMSLLDGGMIAYAGEGYPVVSRASARPRSGYPVRRVNSVIADAEYILSRLNDGNLRLIDARSPEEFRGEKILAARGGHIPGAINIDWINLMDRSRNVRLKTPSELADIFSGAGVEPENEIVVYCQTNHRSSLTYIALKSLGFKNVRGYAGAWSDWGNRSDTPIEM
jgi:thiosulfate/3-mercaptopyruvate sulfurtransferase